MARLSLIDTHAHVQFPAYDEDREAVIARALEGGIGLITVGTQYSTSEDAVRLADQYADVWATVGFHPNHVDVDAHHDPWELHEKTQETFDYQKILGLAHHSKVVAIGECGLDYYRLANSQEGAGLRGKQKEVFRAQIALAQETKKPLILHCRHAFTDLVETLLAKPLTLATNGNGVVHFFSGTVDDARKLIELGFFIAFGGVITFARDYDEVVRYVPLDRLLVETDCPYVAPVPYRGKRNEPAYLLETVKKVAELKGIHFEEVASTTFENAKKLFGI